MRRMPSTGDEIQIGNIKIDRLAYADDVDLLGQLFYCRDQQLSSFRRSAKRVGLEMHEGKTKAMCSSRLGRDVDFVDLDGLMIEVVDAFKYLGSTVTHDNDVQHEIQLRIASGSKCSWALKDILRSRNISLQTKLQTYTTIVRPIVTYGCETWALTKELERQLMVFEHSILRRILGPVRDEHTGEWRIRHNAELRQLTNLAPITSFIRSQRLRWAGHVARIEDNAMVKRVTFDAPPGRRPPGRPRRRWHDNILQDIALFNVDDPARWTQLAQNRQRWRALVKAAKDHMGLQLQE